MKRKSFFIIGLVIIVGSFVALAQFQQKNIPTYVEPNSQQGMDAGPVFISKKWKDTDKPTGKVIGLTPEAQSLYIWGGDKGLPFAQGLGANYGVSTFEPISKQEVAFLSLPTNEIIISSSKTGEKISAFTLGNVPRDFTFQGGKFYVLQEMEVAIYSREGRKLQSFPLKELDLGEWIERVNETTYVLAPNGNSFPIESNGKAVEQVAVQGWVMSDGKFAELIREDDFTFAIRVMNSSGLIISEKKIKTEQKVGSVRYIGNSNNQLYVDVQFIKQEAPLLVDRYIYGFDYVDGKVNEQNMARLFVPNIYYCLMSRDMRVVNGNLYHLLTAPENAHLFQITQSDKEGTYPREMVNRFYHFNEHTLKED